MKQKDLKRVDPKLYEVLSMIFQPNEDAMEHLSFASPKVIINIDDLNGTFGFGYSNSKIELLSDQKVIRARNISSAYRSIEFIIPDPSVSYISFDDFVLRATIVYDNGVQIIKECAFNKDELIAMEGFPSDIHLTGAWIEVN